MREQSVLCQCAHRHSGAAAESLPPVSTQPPTLATSPRPPCKSTCLRVHSSSSIYHLYRNETTLPDTRPSEPGCSTAPSPIAYPRNACSRTRALRPVFTSSTNLTDRLLLVRHSRRRTLGAGSRDTGYRQRGVSELGVPGRDGGLSYGRRRG